jgi:hypothetical protein
MTEDPPGDAPFRGGFRFLAGAEGTSTVDAWGNELAQLLARSVEGAFRAAGAPVALTPAPPFRLEARGDDVAGLIGALTVAALGALAREGRYASVASCRSVVSVEPGGSLEPGVAAVVLCDGGFVSAEGDAGLRRIAPTDDPVGVWEENGILRARFHVRERPAALDEDRPET